MKSKRILILDASERNKIKELFFQTSNPAGTFDKVMSPSIIKSPPSISPNNIYNDQLMNDIPGDCIIPMDYTNIPIDRKNCR